MAFETTLTVPTAHVLEVMTRLGKAGFLVLDTGDRVSSEEGVGAEATLRLAHITVADLDAAAPLGVIP
jgi:hypothetical protein